MSPSIIELDPRAGHEILHRARDEQLARLGQRRDALADVDRDAADVLVYQLTLAGMEAGSGLEFEDRGEHELKGVGAWRLYSVVDA